MKKIISICSALVFAFAISMVQEVNAQDYQITFAGTGASTTVSSVEVENLSTGVTITLNGGDILHLTSVVGISQLETNNSSAMRIYPNPMMDNSILELHPSEAGDAVITVYEMTSKTVTKLSTYLENSRQEFRLSGLRNGLYLISARGNSYHYSGKILCSGQADGNPGIEKVSNTNESNIEKISKKEFNQTQGTVDMYYTAGDRLKFKAISGIYSCVKTDIPYEDKTITFSFIQCTDGDNNNYPVVEIGGQIWMAENLRTTKFNDGNAIPIVTDSLEWALLVTPAYCWYENDETTYNPTYGPLYNWYTISTGKLCPEGWHVPTHEEWTVLVDYLEGEELAGGKLKEAGLTHWFNPNTSATNETGFSALPGGYRSFDGGFFMNIGGYGYWWNSTESSSGTAWFRYMDYSMGSSYSYSDYKQDGLSVRCIRDVPTLTTQDVADISTTSARGGGDISNDWGYPVTERGVCWSSLHIPTVSDSLTLDGSGIGIFKSELTSLQPNTTYFIRAYATNSLGTGYGEQVILKTMTGQISDIDNNYYYTVTIGTQVWMAENLKTTRYRDGITIPLVTDASAWDALSTAGYCWYNNDVTSNKGAYGALYNFYAVNTGKLCPTGWHVPTDTEWKTLEIYLGMGLGDLDGLEWRGTDQGTQMKSSSGWISGGNGTNASGFSVLPGGYRYYGGTFVDLGGGGALWSSTEYDTALAWSRGLGEDSGGVGRGYTYKNGGFSVRCIMDVPSLITQDVTDVTTNSAKSGGDIATDYGYPVKARGVCWSSLHIPTVVDSLTSDATGIGAFTSSITGLQPNRIYFIRAYATNSEGTGYGNLITFTTFPLWPTLSTTAISNITITSASSGGDVTNIGGANVTARGVCWSSLHTPTISDSLTSNGSGTGAFTSVLTGLKSGTTYYVRAYATNTIETSYGAEYSFTTYSDNAIKDIDGNYYNIITLGTQQWLAENLKTTKYSNGDLIGTTSPATLNIWDEVTPKYQWACNGDDNNLGAYGRLYTWYTVTDSRNLCPVGWHVPSDAEWTVLTDYLGGESIAGSKLKEPDFSALMAGYKDGYGYFWGFGYYGRWWSSSSFSTIVGNQRLMCLDCNNIIDDFQGTKPSGFSVRCLRN